jgi:hypothetical protein
MATTEQDHGGVVQGIVEPKQGLYGTAKKSIITTTEITRRPRTLADAAEEEQEPGRPLPDRTVKATPAPFGKFAQQKRK